MLWGLSEIAGDDGMTPRRIERLVRPGGSISLIGHGSLGIDDVFASPSFDLLGVRRVVGSPRATAVDPRFQLEYGGPDGRVYRNEQAFPRAFVAGRSRCVDDETAMRLILDRSVNLREEVLLASCQDPARPGSSSGATAEITRYLPDRVAVRTTSPAPGYLVLTDTWFPGWRVLVDGRERPLLRADYALRAVEVDAGPHEVEFRYQPGSVRAGLWISLAAAAMTAVLGARGWIWARRPR
jgi:hypothetical protein